MSSTLFKAVFAGAITVGALLLPVTAAQASVKHHPCDGPGFRHGAFFGHRHGFFGNRHGSFGDRFGSFDDGFGSFDDGLGSFDDGLGSFDDGLGFDNDRQDHDTTVIVVTVPQKNHHHHKPAAVTPAPVATDNGADAGYHKKRSKHA